MIVARCHFIHGGHLDMAARDSADVDRIRTELTALQQRRDPVAGAKALMDRQQQMVAQVFQSAATVVEGGPEQAALQMALPDEALVAFEAMMGAVPAAPDGYRYEVPSTGRNAWLLPEGVLDVRNVEDVELPAEAG